MARRQAHGECESSFLEAPRCSPREARNENGLTVTARELVSEMRAWLSDCEWQDVDNDEIAAMPDSVIVRAVETHYEGGVTQFKRDSLYVV
jgi:hypothetical protein